jgi:hypothetical protein
VRPDGADFEPLRLFLAAILADDDIWPFAALLTPHGDEVLPVKRAKVNPNSLHSEGSFIPMRGQEICTRFPAVVAYSVIHPHEGSGVVHDRLARAGGQLSFIPMRGQEDIIGDPKSLIEKVIHPHEGSGARISGNATT